MPTSVDGAAEFPFVEALAAMTPHLDATADELERPILVHDLRMWLTDAEHPARAALLENGGPTGLHVTKAAIDAVMPVLDEDDDRDAITDFKAVLKHIRAASASGNGSGGTGGKKTKRK